jgi:signal transduction histidine kinase/ligand-binding sensor domain-containing protein
MRPIPLGRPYLVSLAFALTDDASSILWQENAICLIIGGSRYVLRALEVCLFITLACASAVALDRSIAQFAHTAWGPRDGAPTVIDALAQSADGYLWIGSADGLYRFDGVLFERYQPRSGGPFPGRRVASLFALPNGDLWIGFRGGGISLVRNGTATHYSLRQGVPEAAVWCFAQDREGMIWAATASGLVRLEGNLWKKVGSDWGFPGRSANTVYLDRQGTLWVSTEDTLVSLPRGARKFQPTGIRVGQVFQIAQAENGKLWMPETTRSVRPIPLKDNRQPSDETEIQVGSVGILFDDVGALWITSVGDGLRRAPAPESLKGRVKEFSTGIESFTSRDGLSDDVVRTILQDREGNIWVGTSSGLDRFRKTNLTAVTLPFKAVFAVMSAGDAGDIWVESLKSAIRVHGGRADGSSLLPSQASYAYRDPFGAIWWVCFDDIYRYSNGHFTTVALPPSFPKPYQEKDVAATEDASGTLWLDAIRQGLFYRRVGKWRRLESASEFAKLTPRAAFTDGMGRAWFGFEEGTIIILNNETIQKVFASADSPVGSVRAINGLGHHTWVGGESGMAFFDGNRFQKIIPVDADAFGSISGIEETNDGTLWLAESRGVIRVPASEVRLVLSDPSHRVYYRLFDVFDGLQGTFAGIANSQREIQGTDGKLWFLTSAGVLWIDPANIYTNTLPPPVSIRSVSVNGRQFDSFSSLILPPRTTNLQINYTALSLSVPERVSFRYRLAGVDKEWQNAGTRREVVFTRLGPGTYRFQVIACNNDGVWNDAGATIVFTIAPAWFQTIWFLTMCVAGGLLLVFTIYRLRVRQVANAISARFDERLDERTRIARDLHDTLLQTIQGSKLVADSALKRAENPSRMLEALEQLSIWLARATTEGRTALNSLRTSTTDTNDLAQAFREALAECRSESALETTLSVMGNTKDLHPIVREEVYRIGYEAIVNAYLHSQASKLQVTLNYSDEFSIDVADNGVGMDPAVAERGKEGHFGLCGMRERAARITGRLTVTTSSSSGTQVKLTVPGKIIYRKITSKNG